MPGAKLYIVFLKMQLFILIDYLFAIDVKAIWWGLDHFFNIEKKHLFEKL